MQAVSGTQPKINVIFWGNHPFFINLGPDLERAGCKTVYFPQIHEDLSTVSAIDLSVAKSGDKMDELKIGKRTSPYDPSKNPEPPTEITEPHQVLQYAKAYLEAHGYETSIGKR
ncbi:MAG: hypothetical protein A3I68_00230 [Candidatus Melainabacteria bacterium RIFCSPLOWO2_02_FULL_35_15]|nr:MAG: hypothetical protein A3F80_05840 [Candidatus Melainabacteria bacterium RIFCSPLOWO2_12_FULL_35_11]OGI14820.1 MAG: hypothetical protein A3I68_00230 [Candidatus Melainabacteria bacterium RIFCSPLOWO2_02_FULL_35_15]